jgi:hypothetical protein
LFPKSLCTRSGNRTRTRFRANRILSPACLPVPPSEQMVIIHSNAIQLACLPPDSNRDPPSEQMVIIHSNAIQLACLPPDSNRDPPSEQMVIIHSNTIQLACLPPDSNRDPPSEQMVMPSLGSVFPLNLNPFLVGKGFGAKDEIRTRDPDLGKVVLYQLSYFRILVSANIGTKAILTSVFYYFLKIIITYC